MLQISKDTLSNSTEDKVLQISKDTLSNSTEEKIQALTKELAELVIQFKVLEQKVKDNDKIFSTDSLRALTGTIKDLFSTNIEADVFNSDKHSFSTGLEAQYLIIQSGTIVYAHTEESYILVIWLNTETYIVITPDKYLWQLNSDFTLSLPSGDTFLFSYIGTGASNTETTLSEALRLFNSGCTIEGAFNSEYSGVYEFLEGIVVGRLLKVEGQSKFNGDIDINGNVTITGDTNLKKNLNTVGNITSNGALTVTGDIKASSNAEINGALTVKGDTNLKKNLNTVGNITSNGTLTVTGDIKASSNAEINGALTVKGDIIQQGSSYETHAEKLYTKNNIIITRDGAVSALTDNEVTGIQAKLYDGTNDGQLVFSKDGVARVGDIGDLQPLATREETPINGAVAVWDSASQKYGSKSIDNTPQNGSTNLVTSSAVYSAIANRGRFYTASCSTAGSTQKKEISISNYTLVVGDIIGVTFTNANTYGDSIGSTKTYPLLYINRGSSYYTMEICDSRGHSCGTGCWNNGDYIEFRVISSTKVCIINSDIRQSVSGTSGYTIYADSKIVYSYVQTNITLNYGENLDIPIKILKTSLYEVCIHSMRGNLWFMGNTDTSNSNYLVAQPNAESMTVTTLTKNQKVFFTSFNGSAQTYSSIRVVIRTI